MQLKCVVVLDMLVCEMQISILLLIHPALCFAPLHARMDALVLDLVMYVTIHCVLSVLALERINAPNV